MDPWLPGFHTPTLTGTEDFVTDGDRLIEFIDLAWPEISLDVWQRWLLRHILERFPADYAVERLRGRLRFRQALVSLGRQNGKSVLAAALGLYALLFHQTSPEVLSVASTVEQANIVYDRVRHVVSSNKVLSKRYKPTGTRGIRGRTDEKPGTYYVRTNREEALQGYPASFVVADEVHLLKHSTWTALQMSTSAQYDGMLLGITTAGDEKSELLKALYVVGKSGEDERFFFALWEAPVHLPLTDPQFLISANPAIACGRMDLEQELNALKTMPEQQARRYRGNQFVASANTWLPLSNWQGLRKDPFPVEGPYVFAVDRAEDWTAATITANAKRGGVLHTKVIASLVNPTIDSVEEALFALYVKHPASSVVMEAANLKDLAMRLRERGVTVEYLSQSQVQNACSSAYAAIAEGRVSHANDLVVSEQIPKSVSKNVGDAWRISRRDSDGNVDAVIATVIGLYGAETIKVKAPFLFAV